MRHLVRVTLENHHQNYNGYSRFGLRAINKMTQGDSKRSYQQLGDWEGGLEGGVFMLSPDGKKKIHIRAEGKPTSRTWILVKLPRKPHHRALLGPISCVLPKVSTPLHDPDPIVYSCRLRHGYKAWWSICLAKCYDFTQYLCMAIVFENSWF